MKTSIDFIGDIHGHCDCLKALLKKLGYVYERGAYRYPNNLRQVIFLGDYVDRGPKVRETLDLVRGMHEAGTAIALMGNHEFNMLSFWQKNGTGGGHFLSKMDDSYLRCHSFNKIAVHSKTISDFVGHQEEFQGFLEFVKTLPFYIETPYFRAQHASFNPKAIEMLKKEGINSFAQGNFNHLIARANDEYNEYEDSLFWPLDILLKGPELQLPEGMFFYDGEGVKRNKMRLRWWVDPAIATLEELNMQPGIEMPHDWHPKLEKGYFYGKNERPVFFGHYWLRGTPYLMGPNVCCVDFGVARFDKCGCLAAYRFDGEQELDENKFVWVKANSN